MTENTHTYAHEWQNERGHTVQEEFTLANGEIGYTHVVLGKSVQEDGPTILRYLQTSFDHDMQMQPDVRARFRTLTA